MTAERIYSLFAERRFIICAFHCYEKSARSDKRNTIFRQNVQRRHRPADCVIISFSVVRIVRKLFGSAVNRLRHKPRLTHEILYKSEFLFNGIQKSNLQIGSGNKQGKTGKSCAASYINELCAERRLFSVQHRKGIGKMLYGNLLRLRNRRQIYMLVPAKQALLQKLKSVKRNFIQLYTHILCVSENRFSVHNASRIILSAAISAGLTPLILLACPRFSGRIFESFSTASRRSPFKEE